MHVLISELKQKAFQPDSPLIFGGEFVQFQRIEQVRKPTVQFADTILFHKYKKQYEMHRRLSFVIEYDKQYYKVHLHKSLTEANALIERLAMGLAGLVILFLAATLGINRFFFQKIWSEFFITIRKIKKYDPKSKSDINFPESEIVEFQQLNIVLDKMIAQIKHDFTELKEFTENLTHEIQTPLAVVKSKVELLLQNPDLKQKDSELIHAIYSQVISLSKLNKSLILITKIENNQFADNTELDMNAQIRFHLDNFEDILEAKRIEVLFEEEASCLVQMDKNLCDILLVNLLKNAVRHNVSGGEIRVNISKNSLQITNTGTEPHIDGKEVFRRYSFESDSEASLGLGLTIVKKICDFYRFSVNYSYIDFRHCFRIQF